MQLHYLSFVSRFGYFGERSPVIDRMCEETGNNNNYYIYEYLPGSAVLHIYKKQ